MFDESAFLAEEHATALAALPLPACVRSLRAASCRDHRQAESQRKACRSPRAKRAPGRISRLIRGAIRAQERADELALEVR